MQTSLDNTLNDLCHEIKFENCVKHKNNFLVGQNISLLFLSKNIFQFLEKYLCSFDYEKRMQTSLDNALNDLCHEVKFENCVKHKNNFLVRQNISLLFLSKNIF